MKTLEKAPVVDIVIPVYNEQAVLARSVQFLRNYLLSNFPYSWRITIADTASTDQTWQIARGLEETFPGQVRALHLDQKGRGRALRYAWTSSDAEIVAYMDVDLSTTLDCLLPLIAPLVSGNSQIAIGSRLAKGATVQRQFKREFISRCYNLLIKASFGPVVSDAQCGFKAMRRELAQNLLPLIENNEWFFDTEMLLIAAHNKLRIFEVPVTWVEDLDTRVNIKKTVLEDLRGLRRMRLKFWKGEGKLTFTPAIEPISQLDKVA